MFSLQINGANLVITNDLIGQTVDTVPFVGSWFARATYFKINAGVAYLTNAGGSDNYLWTAPVSQLQNANGVKFTEASLLDFSATFLGRADVPAVIPVTSSRVLTQGDNGATLDLSPSVIVTIPPALINFGFAIRPLGSQVACGAGVTTNGDNTTKTTTVALGAVNPTATANAYDFVGD